MTVSSAAWSIGRRPWRRLRRALTATVPRPGSAARVLTRDDLGRRPVITTTPIVGVAGHPVSGTSHQRCELEFDHAVHSGVPTGMSFNVSGATITAIWRRRSRHLQLANLGERRAGLSAKAALRSRSLRGEDPERRTPSPRSAVSVIASNRP